jgi:hypothetical protein
MSTLSKATVKMLETISTLTEKAKTSDLTNHELVRLINAKLNVSDKTLSGVFKNVCEKPDAETLSLVQLMCGGVIPTFETFKTEMLKKDAARVYFSKYDGLLALSRLSKSAKLATKVAKQGGIIEKVIKTQQAAAVKPKATKAAKTAAV